MEEERLDTTLDKIRRYARFVAGVPSRFRQDDDPRVQRTGKDCHAILAELPPFVSMPSIISGTRADPDVYVSLYWLIAADELLCPTIDVLGTGKCHLAWTDIAGNEHKKSDLPVTDINKTNFFKDLAKLSGLKP